MRSMARPWTPWPRRWRAAYPRLSHRYYALKAKAMGKTRLDHWDRNAPIETTTPRAFTWSQGREIVLDSFSDLGGDFAERAGGFFDKPWIDGRARAGKQSGAYAHPVTADRHPYVFLNWMGERRDVLTLAHELGHGVHQTLAADQGTLLAGHAADPGRDGLHLRRGPDLRPASGDGAQGRTARSAGRPDRGRAEHRGPPDRLPTVSRPDSMTSG